MAIKLGSFAAPEAIAVPTGPTLSIAHFRTSPQSADAIAHEAQQLTIEAVNGVGGIGRFISRGDTIGNCPVLLNIASAR